MRKSGAKIKHNVAIMPLGVKRNKYELDARIAMMAIEKGMFDEQHIVDLWVLADLCERLNQGKEKYISVHAASVKKLAADIQAKEADSLTPLSIVSSGGILLDWVHKQDNKKVFNVAMQQIKSLTS